MKRPGKASETKHGVNGHALSIKPPMSKSLDGKRSTAGRHREPARRSPGSRRARATARLKRSLADRTEELDRANRDRRVETTRRRSTEAALRESEEYYRWMVESTGDYAIIFLDPRGRVATWNMGAQRNYGYAQEEILGRYFSCFYSEEDVQAGKPERLLRAARRGRRVEEEGWRVRKDGSRFWASVVMTALHDKGGRLRGYCKVARDITERRQAQEALRRSQQTLSDFFEQSPLGLFWIAPDGRIWSANRAALALLGCRRDVECLGRSIVGYFVDPVAAADILEQLARGEVVQHQPARLQLKQGTLRHVLVDANGFWEGGRMAHSRWFVRDVTRRVELEREILVAAEHERQRLGQDLHDDLCQQLTGIEFLGQALAGQLQARGVPEARQVQEFVRMIREAITHARDLARGLSPMTDGAAGLRDALEQLAKRMRTLFQVDCRFHCRTPVVSADNEVSIHLYRIAQEAVTNAVRHGKARRIDLSLGRRNGKLRLAVKDSGIGMSGKLREGMGLRAMKYRVGLMGGDFSVRRNPHGGTEVLCEVQD